MATHSNILAWRVPMDRRAWRATVHGVAKVTGRLAQHSTLCYRSILCAFDSALCSPEDPRGKLGSLQLLIELNQWAAFGEWARRGWVVYCFILSPPWPWRRSRSPRLQPWWTALLDSCSSLISRPLRPGGGQGFLLLLVLGAPSSFWRCPKPYSTLHSPFIRLFSLQIYLCACPFLLETHARTRCSWPFWKNSGPQDDREMGSIWREGQMRAWDRRGSDARVGRKAVEKTPSFALLSAYLFWLCYGDNMCVH